MKVISRISFILILCYITSCSEKQVHCDANSLYSYAHDGYMSKIDACFKNGTDVLIEDEKGKTLYSVAREAKQDSVMQQLRSIQSMKWKEAGYPLSAKGLYDAISFNNPEIVNYYAEQKFNLTDKYFNGMAPIVEAIFDDSYDVLPVLLDHGVDVAYEFDFRPLITIAAMFNQQTSIEMLLDYGADINDIDGSGVTPLMFAALDGDTDFVQFLLNLGADKSIKDIVGETALDKALKSNHENLKELLSEG